MMKKFQQRCTSLPALDPFAIRCLAHAGLNTSTSNLAMCSWSVDDDGVWQEAGNGLYIDGVHAGAAGGRRFQHMAHDGVHAGTDVGSKSKLKFQHSSQWVAGRCRRWKQVPQHNTQVPPLQ
eukprot:1161129-Pelagomonas_calceolata.AAC.4